MIRCHVTDRKQGDIIAAVRRAIDINVDMIQVREKDLDAADLVNLVLRIASVSNRSATRVLVNDRLDVALAAGISGLHLPTSGLPVARARPLVDLLGVSTHTTEEAVVAENDGVDFVIFGPVFQTPGKTPVGLGRLKHVCQTVSIPVLAIGGINEKNIPLVMKAGAAGIAAIRMFQG